MNVDIHQVKSIEVQTKFFNSFKIYEFTITDEDGGRTTLKAFTNRNELQIQRMPDVDCSN